MDIIANKQETRVVDGKLRNMTSIYITNADKMLLLLRQGGSVVNDV